MKVSLDRDRCAGHALCYAAAPHLFPLDDAGYSVLESRVAAAGDEEATREGVNACPEVAFTLDES